jgi:hypothetical protein
VIHVATAEPNAPTSEPAIAAKAVIIAEFIGAPGTLRRCIRRRAGFAIRVFQPGSILHFERHS